MPMTMLIGLAVTMLLLPVSTLPASANEPMFRCDDGTFTNVAERMCEPYEPKGTVLVLPEGASFASMRALLGEPAAKTALLPDPASICNLYKEWQALNLRSGGGGHICEYSRRAAVDVPLPNLYRDRSALLPLTWARAMPQGGEAGLRLGTR